MADHAASGKAPHRDAQGDGFSLLADPPAKDDPRRQTDGGGSREATDRGDTVSPLAADDPVARVMVEVPTILFDAPFDYLVPASLDTQARPGCRVRVRLNNSTVDGVVWQRVPCPSQGRSLSDLRPIDAVLSQAVWVPDGLRRDLQAIADATGGTVSQLLRLALPDVRPTLARRPGWGALCSGTMPDLRLDTDFLARQTERMTGDYPATVTVCPVVAASGMDRPPNHSTGAATVQFTDPAANQSPATGTDPISTIGEAVWDVLPGPDRWARDTAWLVARTVRQGRRALVELPDSRHITLLLDSLRPYGLERLELPTKTEIGRLSRRTRGQGGTKHTEDTEDITDSHSCRPITADFMDSTESRAVCAAAARPLTGQVAVIDSDDMPTSRTLGFLAAATGSARVVIGTRAAMYAPMPDGSLFIAVDDDAYQNWDGFMPYAGVRDVLRLRARLGHGRYIALGLARSAFSQRQVRMGAAEAVTGGTTALARSLPRMDWLNHDRLAHLADPAIGSRLPHRAVEALRQGLEDGPVLVVPGSNRPFSLFVCAGCGRQARCTRCSGPLASAGRGLPPVCAWCGTQAVDWICPHCGGRRLRIARFSVGDTAEQLRSLLPGAVFIVREKIDPASVQHGKKRLVPQIPDEPCVVVAAPQSVPQVVGEDGTAGGYRTVVLLDAWTAGYAQRLDGLSDMLGVWMGVTSQALPASHGGQALLVGDCPEDMGQAWRQWKPGLLLKDVLASRRASGLPPTVAAASVWGRGVLVHQLLSRIGALDGDMSTIEIPADSPSQSTPPDLGTGTRGAAAPGSAKGSIQHGSGPGESVSGGSVADGSARFVCIPSVMGPLEIRPQETQRHAPAFEGAGDRVRAVVRVPLARADELAYRLRVVAANIEREGRKGELRYWMNPKDLRER